MADIKIDDLGEKGDGAKKLRAEDAADVKGGASSLKIGDIKGESRATKPPTKSFGESTGEGPSTF